MITSNNSQDNSPEKLTSRSTINLLISSFDLIKDNFLLIFKLFCLIAAVELLFWNIDSRFFVDISSAILSKNFHIYHSLSINRVLLYLAIKLIHIITSFCLYFLFIISIEKNINISEALLDLSDRFFSIIFSVTLYFFIITCVVIDIFLLFGVVSFFTNFSLGSIVALITLLFMLLAIMRCSFVYVITIAEERYFLESFSRSFSYTKGSSFAIVTKIFYAFLVTSLISLIVISLGNGIKNSLALDITFLTNYIASFLSSQFNIIFLYLLYQSYKTNLSQDLLFSKNSKIFIWIIVIIPFILLILLILSFALNVNIDFITNTTNYLQQSYIDISNQIQSAKSMLF